MPLPARTDFRGNAFAIDPEGCGCTDCLTGEAVHPSNVIKLREIIEAGRSLINRTGHEVILPNGYRLDDDRVWHPLMGSEQYHCPGCTCYR